VHHENTKHLRTDSICYYPTEIPPIQDQAVIFAEMVQQKSLFSVSWVSEDMALSRPFWIHLTINCDKGFVVVI